jgi:AraC-like DNA-binding protein
MIKNCPRQLAEVGFQKIMPSPKLRPFIQWFWSIRSNGYISQKYREFMHSNGSLSLLFNWGDELQLQTDWYRQSVILEKVITRSREITLTGNLYAFGVLFRPGGTFPLFGRPMPEATDIKSLSAINLNQLQIQGQLADLPTLQCQIEVVESKLIDLLSINHAASIIIPFALKSIGDTSRNKSAQQIADYVDLSPRQLERKFRNEVGLSPKAYANLMHVHRARRELKLMEGSSLADIAHYAGYYDQAHFNREFKRIIGITPGNYIERKVSRAY